MNSASNDAHAQRVLQTPALDADGYVVDEDYQHGRRGTITARTPQGAVYAIPLENGAGVASLSYESAVANDVESRLQSNPTYSAAAADGGESVSLPTAYGKQPQQQRQRKQKQQQQSVYLGFGDGIDNETDNV